MKKNFLITVIFFIFCVIISLLITGMIRNDSILKQKQIVTNLAANTAYTIQVQLSTSLSATNALAALIRHNGKINDFDSLANEMLNTYIGISSLQLAPNGIVTEIFPIKGNENAKGNLLDDPIRKTEAFAAIKSGKLTLAGPYELKQGGIGIIGRYPVFINKTEKNEFWGFTIVVLKLKELLEKSTLQNLESSNHYYKLWRIHPDSGKPYIFATNNSKNIWHTPINFQFLVPNGMWTLSIEPKNSWNNSRNTIIMAIISLIFSLLLSSLVFMFLKHHYLIKQNAIKLAEMNASKDKFSL